MFERIAVIGLGLIGSSVARAVRERGLAEIIAAYDPGEHALAFGRRHDFIDLALPDAAQAAKGSELVILAAPPSALEELARQIAPVLMKGAIVMDTASVKEPAVEAVAPHLPKHAYFIPAHPIAGSEKGGAAAGRADLFEGKRVILSPAGLPDTAALKKATSFWTALGAKPIGMPPALHDTVYGYVSHLPQLLSFALKKMFTPIEKEDATLKTFLRLTGSPPELWTDIFISNKNNIVSALDNYLKVVSHVRSELGAAPADAVGDLDEWLARTLLFPRIAASCLVTTVMEAERAQGGMAFARYAGGGFADFISPANASPEEDMEKISAQHVPVGRLLDDYLVRLKRLREVLISGDTVALRSALAAN